MCLYPKLIINPKYKPNKKNGHKPPVLPDDRVKYVPIGCQNCIECKKQKARQWQVRLMEDVKTHTNGKFITLTFSNEEYADLFSDLTDAEQTYDYNMDNRIATMAVRRFLERWRKKYKKSLRHWLVTELGHQGTNNIHLHGIIWTDKKLTDVEKIWQYGFVWKGKTEYIRHGKKLIPHYVNYVNQKTASYITKYMTKVDFNHKTYKAKILTSPGIGHNYTNTYDSKNNSYSGTTTNETYRTSTGHKISLPIYWRNKIYTEKQREELWLNKINKQLRWICGEKINISKGLTEYYQTLSYYQEKNTQLGYGNDQDWKDEERKQYERINRMLAQKTRILRGSAPLTPA